MVKMMMVMIMPLLCNSNARGQRGEFIYPADPPFMGNELQWRTMAAMWYPESPMQREPCFVTVYDPKMRLHRTTTLSNVQTGPVRPCPSIPH